MYEALRLKRFTRPPPFEGEADDGNGSGVGGNIIA
jgi:hypothetical protein